MRFSRSGILLLDKAEGPSSAQVVARVKRSLGARKVGHLGTLDPFASGLLPLGINEGTKIAQLFLDADKSYTGTMILGAETDSQDRTGKVLCHQTVPELEEGDLLALRRAFTGRMEQIPPMFSALKRNGVRLYQLARRGKAVPRGPRRVEIRSLELRQNSREEIGFTLTCSKGTYVRTLVSDMGKYLGCGAYLNSLRRVRCGQFKVSSALTLEQLEYSNEDELPILPVSAVLTHLPAVVLEEPDLLHIRTGRQEALSLIREPKEEPSTMRIVDRNENLVALVKWQSTGRVWKIARVFNVRDDSGQG